MDLPGDIIQSLANYLGLEDLASTASFPDQIGKLKTLIARYNPNIIRQVREESHSSRISISEP